VAPVRDQGACGAEWALVAAAALEGACCAARGTRVALSAAELYACAGGAGGGCAGGEVAAGYAYEVAARGLCAAAAYRPGAAGACAAAGCAHECAPARAAAVAPGARAPLLAALAGRPVAVAVDAASFAFQMYTGGVLTGDACGTQLDHALLAVAYNLTAPTPFLRAQNSWGAAWGDHGFVDIGIEDEEGPGVCGVYGDASYLVMA